MLEGQDFGQPFPIVKHLYVFEDRPPAHGEPDGLPPLFVDIFLQFEKNGCRLLSLCLLKTQLRLNQLVFHRDEILHG